MVSGTLRVKGRHARPANAEPTQTARTTFVTGAVRRGRATLAGVAGSLRPVSRRTKLLVAGAGGLAVASAATVVGFASSVPADSGTAPKGATAVDVLAGRPVPATLPSRPARSAHRGDEAALAFYASRDPLHATHVSRVEWTGPMLRVYTDLPASDADSRTAIALCETAAAYAETQSRIPAVFVHANRAAGYPVLANKMDATDDCRLDRVP